MPGSDRTHTFKDPLGFGRVYCLEGPSIRPFQDICDALGRLKLDERAPRSRHAFEILRAQ